MDAEGSALSAIDNGRRGDQQKKAKRSKSLSVLRQPRRASRRTTRRADAGDIVIAIMGPTGVGKSTFINTIIGQGAATVGHTLQSCTEDVRTYTITHPNGSGRRVVFVDTPGFDDDKISDADILKKIANWLASTYRKGNILTGLLYLHRISDNRMAGTPLKNLTLFRNLVGPDAMQNVLLVTTMWDELETEEGRRREQQLRQNYWKSMIAAGSQVTRFERSRESAWEILNRLSGVARAVRLQEELVDQGLPLAQTDAGSTLFGWLMDRIHHFRDIIRKLEARLRGGEPAPALTHERDVVEDRLEQVEEQVELLMQDPGHSSARTTNDRASLEIHTDSTSSTASTPTSSTTSTPTSDPIDTAGRREKLAKTIMLLTHAQCFAEASPIPFLKGAVHLALTVAQLIEGMAVVEESSLKLAQNIADLVLAITDQVKLGPVSEDLNRAIQNLFRELEEIRESLKKGLSPGIVSRYVNQKVDDGCIRDGRQKFRNACSRFEIVASLINNQAIARIERQLAVALSQPCDPLYPRPSK